MRRVHLPKPGGKTRPIGIPTLEDKVLQRAVLMALEPVYEQDFLECSYGSPGLGAEPTRHCKRCGGSCGLRGRLGDRFGHPESPLNGTICPGPTAARRSDPAHDRPGVMEEGVVWYPERGTPQGGVASPSAGEHHLHEVLGVWFEQEVKPRLRGRAALVRYADDATLTFEHRGGCSESCQRDLADSDSSCTRRRRGWWTSANREGAQEGCGPHLRDARIHPLMGEKPSRTLGGPRKTAKDRLSSALKRVGQWCRRNRHWRVADQHRELNRKLLGPLRLLRRDRQLAVAELLPPPGGACGGNGWSTLPCRTPELGGVSTAPGPVPACNTSNRARTEPQVAKPLRQGAGCGSSARPDLWEPWAGNCP